MPPWTPDTPFTRPRDTPGPPLYRHGHVLLSVDRQGPHRAPYLVWPGARNQSGTASGTHFTWPRCWGTYCGKVALPWRHLAITPRIDRRRGAGGGISCAEGDSGPPRDGREPSWARPCEASGALLLSNGGSGGGHAACTLWPPPAPFGYFPVMESTSSARRRTKPPTSNRFLVAGKGKTFLSPSVLRRVSPLRRRPKGFPLALWKPSGPYLLKRLRARKLNLSSSSFQQSDAVSGSYARLSSPGTRGVITPVCTSASRCSGLVSNT